MVPPGNRLWALHGLSGVSRRWKLPLPTLCLPAFLLLATGACSTDITVYRPVDADLLNNRSVLVLESVLLPPISGSQQKAISDFIEQGLVQSPELKRVITREEFDRRSDIALRSKQDYKRLSTGVSLLNVSNPEISSRLGKALDVDLFATVQISFHPCDVCEVKDRLWLVGQVVEAKTGRVVFRYHNRVTPESRKAEDIDREGLELAKAYLEEFNTAFSYKWHRARFNHLKKQG